MSWVFTSIIILTILQPILCHGVSWLVVPFLISIVARALFLGRLIGATVKVKNLIITEAFAFGILLLFNFMAKSQFDILGILVYALISGLCCLLMFIDDTFYLYITEDYVEDQEDR